MNRYTGPYKPKKTSLPTVNEEDDVEKQQELSKKRPTFSSQLGSQVRTTTTNLRANAKELAEEVRIQKEQRKAKREERTLALTKGSDDRLKEENDRVDQLEENDQAKSCERSSRLCFSTYLWALLVIGLFGTVCLVLIGIVLFISRLA